MTIDSNENEREPELSNKEALEMFMGMLMGGILDRDDMTYDDCAPIRSETKGVELLAEGDIVGRIFLDILYILDDAHDARPESIHGDPTSYFEYLKQAQWNAAGNALVNERFVPLRQDIEELIIRELVYFGIATNKEGARQYAINKKLFLSNNNMFESKKSEVRENIPEDPQSMIDYLIADIGLDINNPEIREALNDEGRAESLVKPDDIVGHDKLNLILMLMDVSKRRPEYKDESVDGYLKALGDIWNFAKHHMSDLENEQIFYDVRRDTEDYMLAEIVRLDLETEEDASNYALYNNYLS
ncbi:MAG: hypothetical protein WCO23_02015 [bacterium]